MTFATHSMQEILPLLEASLQNRSSVRFYAVDPDLCCDRYAGETINIHGVSYLCRSLRVWMELAELLGCRMMLPQKEPDSPLVHITFKKLAAESFHADKVVEKEEKYGSSSPFSRIHKMEEAAFYYYYRQALQNVNIEKRVRILDLGVNRGDEITVIKKMVDVKKYLNMEFVGIDFSKSAVEEAKKRFHETNVTLYRHDINKISMLDLGKFDLLISIGTLQSPGISFKPFFMDLVQHYLDRNAAVILGFPNSRWIGGEMVYGAKAPHYRMSEMGLLFSDVMFAKKYLQQKKFRVTITGKQYLFLTATKLI